MTQSELKRLWAEYGFRAKKRLGQNFLIDKNVRDKILGRISADKDSIIVEIGAGFGIMSFELASRCGKLYAVEKDKRICKIMGPVFGGRKNIILVNADILDLDLCSFGERKGITVFGNIPYYISTPVIEKMIGQRKCIKDVYVVMQEELADRIVSPPGSKTYGSLSCFAQFFTDPKKLFRIKKSSFYPSPQVESCLLRLKMRNAPSVTVKDKDLMFRIILKAFSERRKQVINPLARPDFLPITREEWKNIFRNRNIDASSRAEDLSLADYAGLADEVSGRDL